MGAREDPLQLLVPVDGPYTVTVLHRVERDDRAEAAGGEEVVGRERRQPPADRRVVASGHVAERMVDDERLGSRQIGGGERVLEGEVDVAVVYPPIGGSSMD